MITASQSHDKQAQKVTLYTECAQKLIKAMCSADRLNFVQKRVKMHQTAAFRGIKFQ